MRGRKKKVEKIREERRVEEIKRMVEARKEGRERRGRKRREKGEEGKGTVGRGEGRLHFLTSPASTAESVASINEKKSGYEKFIPDGNTQNPIPSFTFISGNQTLSTFLSIASICLLIYVFMLS